MISAQTNGNITGDPECPCLNITIPSHLICKNGADIPYCYPKDYGATCKSHDENYDALCRNDNNTLVKAPMCSLKWCYVDEKKCFQSSIRYIRDDFGPFENKFMSFRTCGDIHPRLNYLLAEREKLLLSTITVDVIVPGSEYPFNYLETDSGDIVPFGETYDYLKSATFKGAYIDYLEEIRKEIGVKRINIMARPYNVSKRLGASMYTAAVYDIRDNMFDVGMSNFWVTAERLNMVSFSVPIYSSELYLYELHEQPQTNLSLSLTNTFLPFTSALCVLTVGVVFLVGLLPRFFRTSRDEIEDYKNVFENDTWKQASFSRRCIIFIRLFIDPLFQTFVDCFGGSTEVHTSPSTLTQKIVTTGFAFFILIVQASYTANLASFLSKKQGNFMKSVKEAIKAKKRICVPLVLMEAIKAKYPGHGNNTFVPVGDPVLQTSIEFMKKRKCDAFIEEHTTLMTGATNADICKGNVPIIGSIRTVAFTIDVAFPVKPFLASYLSRTMDELGYRGVKFEKFLEPYLRTYECNIYVREGGDAFTNEALIFADMSFPILVLVLCMIIGICIKLSKKIKRGSSYATSKIERSLSPHKTS